MMTTARYIISLLLLAAYYLLLTTSPVHAEQPTNLSQLELNSYTNRVVVAVSSALICQITGFDASKQPIDGQPQSCNGDPTTASGQIGGALGTVTGLISATFTPPASSAQYFQYLAGNFGIIKPAYAGEVGFKGLAPLLPIWAVFRNITYAFFVVAFVLVGFTIMLRVKIDPRTVMTIQNQIPKLVIALILVTFSYAIAGLLIDLMYVAIYLSVNIAGQVNPQIALESNKIAQAVHPFDLANILGGLGGTTGGVGVLIANASGSIKDIISSIFTIEGPGKWAFDILVGLITGGIGFLLGGGANVVGILAGIIAFLVIGIAVLFVLFKLWFELLKTYIFILIDVIFAPFWILVGVLPGGGLGFSSWLRDIIANLSVFPTTIIMFLLGRIFMDAFKNAGGFVPPLIGPGYTPEVLGSLIGLGIILMSLQVVTMVKEALKVPPFKYGAAVGQAIGVGAGAPGGVVGTGATVGQQMYYFGMMKQGLKGLPIIGKMIGGKS